MRLLLKVFFILLLNGLSFQAFSWTSDYVSAFKPAKERERSLSSLQENIRKDISEIRSMVDLEEKTITSYYIEEIKVVEDSRVPADI